MKYLGIDYGEKKIGLALTDGLGTMAFPKDILHYKNLADIVESIQKYIVQEEVQALVVGMPLYKDGTVSLVGKKVEAFIQKVLLLVPLPCYIVNEYLTSYEARSEMQRMGKATTMVDAYVACLLLEEFLGTAQEKRILYKGEIL